MRFFLLNFVKEFLAQLLVLVVEGFIRQLRHAVFGALFVLLFALKFGAFPGLAHNALVKLPLFGVLENLEGRLQNVETVGAPGVLAFVGMDKSGNL